MTHFLHQLIDPTAVMMLFVFLYALSSQVYTAYTGYRARATDTSYSFGFWPILWIILAILAIIAWAFIVFS